MSTLLEYLPLVLLAVAILTVLVLIYLVVLVFRSSAPQESYSPPAPAGAPPEEDEEEAPLRSFGSAGALKRSFRRARSRLKGYTTGTRPLYRLPWFLVLGAAGSHRPGLWRHAGLSLPFGPPDDDDLALEGLNWWFFDQGVVLDPAGDWVLRHDGRSCDEKRFAELLAMLQRFRPKKPIDGIVLTVSARELLEAGRRGAVGLAELEQRAAQIYRRLWQTQKTLAIRFPIYVLVTDAEELPGFRAFGEELPESLGQEIFGWSSPYSIDAAFQARWIDEAFESLTARLNRAQTQIFGARSQLADADGVFVFPAAVEELRKTLGVYLQQLFKESAYHESTLCRGIYLSGSDETPEAPAHTFFVRELLEGKVFPEGGLARPTGAALARSGRNLRLAQAGVLATVLLLGLGVYRTWTYRDHSRAVFHSFLSDIRDDVVAMDARSGLADRATLRSSRERTERLISSMETIDTNHFRAIFLPTSWPSSFDHDLERAMVEGYRQIIFQTLRREIGRRGRRIVDQFEASRLAAGPPPREPLPVERMEEFRRLLDFVREFAHFEQAIVTFNHLSRFEPSESPREQLREFADLVTYLFDVEISPSFFDNSKLYEAALRKVVVAPIGETSELAPGAGSWQSLTEEAQGRTDTLETLFHERLTARNALALALRKLDESLGPAANPEYDAAGQEKLLRDVLDAMVRTEEVLAHPQIDWAFRDRLDLGPAYADLVEEETEAHFLGAEHAARLERATETQWRAFRRFLASSSSEITGRHLKVVDGVAQPHLSAEVEVLMAALSDFLDQGFMRVGKTQELLRVPSGYRPRWDILLLEQAAALYEPYERFRAKGLAPFPVELRANLERLARARLAAKMLDLVARAQILEPVPPTITPLLVEPDIEEEIAGFEAATEHLHQVLGVFEQLNLRDAERQLSELIVEQGVRLLATVEDLLDEGELYLPRRGGFDWWDGTAPVTLAAFEVSDSNELEIYLTLQRDRLRHLAEEDARPLITALGRTGIDRRVEHSALYHRWEGILKELQAYGNKKPGNSVNVLEELIRTEMPKVTLASCANALGTGGLRGQPRDFFLERGYQLRRSLYERCQDLALETSLAAYRDGAHFFNQRLAGHFPFAGDIPVGPVPVADPDDLRAFFRHFAAYGSYDFAETAERLHDESLRQVSFFVQRMRQVRDFFEPFLADDDGAEVAEGAEAEAAAPAADKDEDVARGPVFDVVVDFRTNREFERNGDQVIDWALELGGRKIELRDEARRGRWRFGEEIRLVLRWAKDGGTGPVLVEPLRGVSTTGLQASWEYLDPWALLSLLTAQRASPEDFPTLTDPRPHTLKLEVPSWSGEVQAAAVADPTIPIPAGELDRTRVFVRIALLAPDSKKPLLLPEFPVRAPSGRGRF